MGQTTGATSRTIGRRARLWTLRIVALVLLLIFAAVAMLFFQQHSLLYHPRPYDSTHPVLLPADAVELRYGTGAGQQTAFYLPRGAERNPPARLWVAFGGNASLALEWLGLIARDPDPSNAYLLVDYPGYGKSEGRATIAANRAAADGALEALANHLGVEKSELEPRLNIIGHSFGAAVALDFAVRHRPRRIVLVAPFSTLREEGALVVGEWLSYLLVENYDNRVRLKELSERSELPRIAIFHGTKDDIIPIAMGRDLAAAHPAMVQFFPVAGGDHLSPLFRHGQRSWLG